MSEYSIRELEQWNERIERIAREAGLCCYEQEFDIVCYEDMISYEAYTGMPSHYPHWSYGKAYERLKTLNKYNLSGLPYEMVINSNPCIAYLMKDNTLPVQILTIAHVYGHNDFFRRNRLFEGSTRADYTIEMFKNHAGRIRDYIADPGIGYGRVEKILNAAHALKFQSPRTSIKRLSEDDTKKVLFDRLQKPKSDHRLLEPNSTEEEMQLDFKRIPIEPEDDLLLFISNYGRLHDWERDIIDIVREETEYFLPQIDTKIMNEGWASFWHYSILNKLELPQGFHIEFIKQHNQVIRPQEGRINPYYLGFKIFESISERYK